MRGECKREKGIHCDMFCFEAIRVVDESGEKERK